MFHFGAILIFTFKHNMKVIDAIITRTTSMVYEDRPIDTPKHTIRHDIKSFSSEIELM